MICKVFGTRKDGTGKATYRLILDCALPITFEEGEQVKIEKVAGNVEGNEGKNK